MLEVGELRLISKKVHIYLNLLSVTYNTYIYKTDRSTTCIYLLGGVRDRIPFIFTLLCIIAGLDSGY